MSETRTVAVSYSSIPRRFFYDMAQKALCDMRRFSKGTQYGKYMIQKQNKWETVTSER